MAVLITRPDERGLQLVESLNKVGIMAIHLPLFSIESGLELNELPNKISQLKTGDYVFAVSKSAVMFSAKTLKDTGFSWRNDLQYFTVGQGTAVTFTGQIEQPVRYPIQQENSEGLLALTEMQNLTDKKILILRGNGGREYFSEQATLRGANIETLECYRRIPIPYHAEEQTSLCKRLGVQRIVVTSMEILIYLMDFIPKNEHNWLKSCQLITVSQRIALFAQKAGWENIVVSPKADNQSLLQTLLQQP